MKFMLIICNIFLTCIAAWSLHHVLSDGEKIEYTAGRDRSGAAAEKEDSENSTSNTTELSIDEAKNSLLHTDVFALSRCPSLENNAQTMTLAGIIITAQTQGAVIIQSTNNRNGQFPQPGMNNNRQRNNNGNSANNRQTSTQRYFLVGEKINDQYTLASVTRTTATLTGPTGTRVLELQKASDGANATRNTGRNWQQRGMMPPWMMGQQGGMMPGNRRFNPQMNNNFRRNTQNGRIRR